MLPVAWFIRLLVCVYNGKRVLKLGYYTDAVLPYCV